ncbi:MAG TPA: DUF1080 domain-containing protein [Sphingobacterium sp.]|nr:DUF1080 domain-containing protein [Sphingobacterium sp.]
MKRNLFICLSLLLSTICMAQEKWDHKSTEWYKPAPTSVRPGKVAGAPPSDAIVLFDGTNLSQWLGKEGQEAQWQIVDKELVVIPGKGDIRTKGFYGDCQLHIEFKIPKDARPTGQSSSNSGVFLQSTYEVQILNADNNPTYVNGMLGSIYKQQAPLVDAHTANGEWQVYDIFWKAPVFGTGGKLVQPAVITVLLNGVLIQNNVTLQGHTPWTGLPEYSAHGRLPLLLQDHGTKISFRNIWIRDL